LFSKWQIKIKRTFRGRVKMCAKKKLLSNVCGTRVFKWFLLLSSAGRDTRHEVFGQINIRTFITSGHYHIRTTHQSPDKKKNIQTLVSKAEKVNDRVLSVITDRDMLVAGHFCKGLVQFVGDGLEFFLLVNQLI